MRKKYIVIHIRSVLTLLCVMCVLAQRHCQSPMRLVGILLSISKAYDAVDSKQSLDWTGSPSNQSLINHVSTPVFLIDHTLGAV